MWPGWSAVQSKYLYIFHCWCTFQFCWKSASCKSDSSSGGLYITSFVNMNENVWRLALGTGDDVTVRQRIIALYNLLGLSYFVGVLLLDTANLFCAMLPLIFNGRDFYIHALVSVSNNNISFHVCTTPVFGCLVLSISRDHWQTTLFMLGIETMIPQATTFRLGNTLNIELCLLPFHLLTSSPTTTSWL